MLEKNEPIGFCLGAGRLALQAAEFAFQKYAQAFFCFTDFFNYRLFCAKFREAKKVSRSIPLTKLKKILAFFRSNSCTVICCFGKLPKFSWLSYCFADKLYKNLAQQLKQTGDDALAKIVLQLLRDEGFVAVSVRDVVPEILIRPGFYSGNFAEVRDQAALGFALLKLTSPFDFGQSVAVSSSKIVAVEGAEGTDEMLRRVNRLGFRNCLLIKGVKISQALELDLPAIGTVTIENLKKFGFKGLVVEADHTVCEDFEKTNFLAKKYSLVFSALASEDIQELILSNSISKPRIIEAKNFLESFPL
jgi:DUF1009 family protein